MISGLFAVINSEQGGNPIVIRPCVCQDVCQMTFTKITVVITVMSREKVRQRRSYGGKRK